MEPLNIGCRREVCWDEALMDRAEGIRVQMHHPEFRNIAMVCDEPWEGNCCGYFTVIPDSEHFRLYYRGSQLDVDQDGEVKPSHKSTMCYAESKDGKVFHRVNAGLTEFWGRRDNNILLDNARDNMYFFRDSNPDCPPEELFKGLNGSGQQQLILFTSPDGFHFARSRVLADDGAYDSLNVAFWDEAEKKYYLYYRGVHGEGSVNGKWAPTEDVAMHNKLVRDVRVRTSTDFRSWSEPKMIRFDPPREDAELYTNQVQKYYRARHMFLGFPTRYVDRYRDARNYPRLPDWDHRQRLIKKWGRSGTAMTDTMIMTSRDGLNFRRTEEAWLTPGIERDCNWYYGDCYFCYGMAETEADLPGAPREISMYVGCDYRVKPIKLFRYAIRLDGFFSWHCDYEPGRVLTKPIVFDGDRLAINFGTSAAGYVRICLLDEDSNALEGYDSGNLFGDSVERTVDFEAPLSALAGKEIRMEITMRDAELYSFQFSRDAVIR